MWLSLSFTCLVSLCHSWIKYKVGEGARGDEEAMDRFVIQEGNAEGWGRHGWKWLHSKKSRSIG